ncbi:MAG: glycosyltransferase family 2 protein [Opitutales bacterium]
MVPCYNEEPVLPEMFRRLRKVCQNLDAPYEIVVVDDGSRDATWSLMELEASRNADIRAVKLSRNFGHEKALAAGLAEARGGRILILDADLQDPPELLPRMMKLMDEGYHSVCGRRRSREGESWLKQATSWFFYWFINLLSDIEIPRDTGDFRLISRAVLDAYLAMPEDRRFNRLMLAWVGFSRVEMDYERAPRFAGVTKYNYRRLLNLAIDGITSFSVRPLKVAMFLAFSAVVVAGVIFSWAVRSWVLGGSVSGWASLIITVLVLGASQLLVIGILGEYIGRLFIENKQRPSFIVEKISAAEGLVAPVTPTARLGGTGPMSTAAATAADTTHR